MEKDQALPVMDHVSHDKEAGYHMHNDPEGFES
jgi:hypothetical protein